MLNDELKMLVLACDDVLDDMDEFLTTNQQKAKEAPLLPPSEANMIHAAMNYIKQAKQLIEKVQSKYPYKPLAC